MGLCRSKRSDVGRFFTTKLEHRRINSALAEHQGAFGTVVQWYFFLPAASVYDDVYGEGDNQAAGGRRWRGPVPIPVISAYRREGTKTTSDDGQYLLDTITLRMSYDQAVDAGLGRNLGTDHAAHINDRFAYDNKPFSVRDIQVVGQFDASGRDPMVVVEGVQLRPDELVNDVDFRRWSA